MAEAIEFQYADAERALTGVRLVQEIGLPSAQLDFEYRATEKSWRLRLPSVAVQRLEYRFELNFPDGHADLICDPDNPRRAPGAFGDKSVLELPGYRRPAWLDLSPAPGSWRELTVNSPALRSEVPIRIWSPATPASGILLAHDGDEYDRLASLGQYSASGAMPPHHLVLLSPLDRNAWYAANPAYARALVTDVLPRIRAELVVTGPVVGLGASLGALALMYTHRQYPYTFSGLFLQSGSFFQHRFDAQESGFPYYRRVLRFVASLRRSTGNPVPTVVTCGTVEENLANNRDLAGILEAAGYPVGLIEVPDAHNFVAWRDGWHPHLAELAAQVLQRGG